VFHCEEFHARAPRGPTQLLRHLLIQFAAIGLLPLALLGVWNIQSASEHRVRQQERDALAVTVGKPA
jgi:hypothetical protein